MENGTLQILEELQIDSSYLYRHSPGHSTVQQTDAQQAPQLSQASGESDIMRKDREDKARMKVYSDRKAYINPFNIQVGDSVLVRRDPSEKK